MMRMETGKNRKKTGSKQEENRNKTGRKPEENRNKTGSIFSGKGGENVLKMGDAGKKKTGGQASDPRANEKKNRAAFAAGPANPAANTARSSTETSGFSTKAARFRTSGAFGVFGTFGAKCGAAVVALALAFFTALSLVTPALAATLNGNLSVDDLTLTASGTGTWTANGTAINGEAPGKKWGKNNTTLTITIKEGSTRGTLFFNYSIGTGGTVQINGAKKTGTGSLGDNAGNVMNPTDTITIKLESSQGYISAGDSASIELTNIKFEPISTNVDITVQCPNYGGTVTVDGETLSKDQKKNRKENSKVQLTATPAEGYAFQGWYDGQYTLLSANATYEYTVRNMADTIHPVFSETGVSSAFSVNGTGFSNFSTAMEVSLAWGAPAILMRDYTLPAGDYTIPVGATLLIPFDAAGTLYTETPTAIRAVTTPKPFRTLTLASGASITVNGAISVGGQYFAAEGGKKGQMTGPYGWIKLEKTSKITVASGGNLYAWGFVSGEGSVTVDSGGAVYEWFQLMDFRGGQETVFKMLKKGVFVISQYTVQNIEAQLTIKEKANEIAYAAIEVGGINYTKVSFIGSNGMFKINSGSLTKKYDRKTDRVKYAVNGTAELNNLSITMTVGIISYTIDSKDYALPLTNNMTVTLKSGSKLTVNQDTALLPGVQINIDQKAELCVPSGYSMYVYDKAQWEGKGYCGAGKNDFIAVPYVTDNESRHPRTSADLLDAEVKVNGTLTAAGAIYTTADGAKIWSEGTGKFVQQGAVGTATKTYQHVQGEDGNKDIPITPAKLLNADGTYTETAGKPNTTIAYSKELEKWGGQPATVVFVGGENSTKTNDAEENQLVDLSDTGATVDCPVFKKDGHKFLGFAVKANAAEPDFAINASGELSIAVSALKNKTTVAAGDTITLYAVYKQSYLHTVDWKVTGADVAIEQTKIMTAEETVTKSVANLKLTGKYIIKSCKISPEGGANQTVTLPADNIKLEDITDNITVTLDLVAYDHIVTVKDTGGNYSQTYYVKNNGKVDVLTGSAITYTVSGKNVISGVTILPEAAKETHDATTATITNITDNVTVTVALEAYDYLVTIKAGGSSETHYVKGDKDVLTNAAITYTAGDKKVITNVTGHTATLTRGEGDVNAYVTDGWKSFTLSGIKANQTVTVTLKDYDWTVNWTLEKQDHGITAKEVSRSYVENGAAAALSMNGFRATGVTGADSAAVTGIGTGVVTISNITANLAVTVTARNYSYAVTWNVNGTQARTDYLDFDANTANYTAGTNMVITEVSVTPAEKATVTHTNTKVTVTGISSDVTVLVTTETPTTDEATYYFGDMSYEYKRNTVLYQWDGKSEDKGQWIPVDSFAWQHKAGSRIYEFEDENLEAIVVPNGSVLLVNGSNQTMQYTVTYTDGYEGAAMTFTAGEKTGSNILSVVLKPGEKIMVSSTFACDVTDKTLTNAPAGQVTVTTEPYNN